MEFVRNAAEAFRMISRLPVGRAKTERGDLKKAAGHFPLVGYAAFAVWCAALPLVSCIFGDHLIAVILAFSVLYYFFNLFHFDGLLDTMDGLFSQKSREDVLRIMKSGNIGPSALFAGALYIALKIYLAAGLEMMLFLPVFVISRWAMVLSMSISKPAKNEGFGSTMPFGKMGTAAASGIYIIPVFFLADPAMVAAGIALVFLSVFVLVRTVEKKLGGLTGDVFGLVNEACELLLMLLFNRMQDFVFPVSIFGG
ncbi:MAG: adenosylcobinamide-GDP ribazoletransferase [Endomicrobiales bacterium]|nr:adenosylcobinamide-GDP ribazoletransferase [Endomicrobiales bacterium]